MTKIAELVKTKRVEDSSLPGVSVTVGMATYKMGLTRTILMDQARQAQRAAQEAGAKPDLTNAVELAEAVGLAMIYPSLIAGVVEQNGFESWPPTAEEVMGLPEPFVAAWEQAVFSLNPHWRARPPGDEGPAEKKD